LKYIKKYINFNNYEKEETKQNEFKINDRIKPIKDYVYFYDNGPNKWVKLRKDNKEIFIITSIKKCHEIKPDKAEQKYKTPCDKGKYLVLLKFYWRWYPLKDFKKI
jgi:hypothetical protein